MARYTRAIDTADYSGDDEKMIRKIARPMLASVFVADGVDTLMNQKDHVEGARDVTNRLRTVLPAQYAALLGSPQTLVQVVGGTKIAAGSLYALGKAPRVSATALALVQVPTALARHSFWETQDPKERKARKTGFLTDVALLGGLFLASADTAGRPGLAWRAEHAGKQVNKKVQAALPTKSEAEKRADELKGTAAQWAEKAQAAGSELQDKTAVAYHRAEDYVADNKDDWKDSLTSFAEDARDTLAGAAETARESLAEAADSARDNFAEVADVAAKETRKSRKQAAKTAKKTRKQARKQLKKLR